MPRVKCKTGALLLAAVMAAGAPAASAQTTRKPALWPFSAVSPWNSPIGTAATYDAPDCDAAVQAENGDTTRPWIHAEQYSYPVYWASVTDPLKTVYKGDSPGPLFPSGTSQGRFRVPGGARPDSGTDHALVLIEPGGRFSDEMWNAYNTPFFVDAGGFARHDLVSGDGFTPVSGLGPAAAHASYLGGLMRTWELQAGAIQHALAMSLTPQRLSADEPLPPASAIDGDHSQYAGPVRMGQLIALPQDLDLDSLGLTSAVGRAIATALQRYGAYVVNKSEAPGLYAESGAAYRVRAARDFDDSGVSDLMRIVGALRCVTDNSPDAWGGGGTPLAPPAPPFG
jgi:hypothetical protein